MAPIPFKEIISVSSEDGLHPARHLLQQGGGRKWLISPDNRTGRAEVVIELSKRARIASIDITNFGSAFIEVHVARSELDPHDFIVLLPSSMLMSVSDSRAKRNRTKTVSYGKDKLSLTALGKKWNQVKIICQQPYNRTEQFGLQYVAIYSEANTPQSPSNLLTPPHTPKLLSPSPLAASSPSTPSHNSSRGIGKLPTLTRQNYGKANFKSPSAPSSKSETLKTPKRPAREKENAAVKEEEFEFSGVERQSRLFRNALKGESSQKSNPILEKIVSEREKYWKQSEALSDIPSYNRKKLLLKELPKVEGGIDFAASYEKGTNSNKDVAAAFSRISAHDNEYEIGEEPEQQWGWWGALQKKKKAAAGGEREVGKKGRRGRSGGCGKWLAKKSKLDDLIRECSGILSRADDDTPLTAPERETRETLMALPLPFQGNTNPSCTCSDSESECDSDATVIEEGVVDAAETCADAQQAPNEPAFIQCPLCSQLLPDYAIEVHASTCGDACGSLLPITID